MKLNALVFGVAAVLILLVGILTHGPQSVPHARIWLSFASYPSGSAQESGLISWSTVGTALPGESELLLCDLGSALILEFDSEGNQPVQYLQLDHRSASSSDCPNCQASILTSTEISITLNGQVIDSGHLFYAAGTESFDLSDAVQAGANELRIEIASGCGAYGLSKITLAGASGSSRFFEDFDATPTSGFLYYRTASMSPSYGLSTGGAKDVGNFRANIGEGYLPLPSDLSEEGLFYDYYFDTGEQSECNELFCPSLSMAVSPDPLSDETEYYMTVGLNSNLTEETFSRPRLNLVIVLDVSTSMDSRFTEYYYDSVTGDDREDIDTSKLDSAKTAVAGLLDHLGPDDQIGLIVFSDEASTLFEMTSLNQPQDVELREVLSHVETIGGTNLESGLRRGYELLRGMADTDLEEVENRMILLTDMMPNLGTLSEYGLGKLVSDSANEGIFTTFVGIGVDFNSELMTSLYDVRGANAFTVRSADDFLDLMADEFSLHVTPVAFDISLEIESDGYVVEKVYGSTSADAATDTVFEIRTLFPSKRVDDEVRGGVVLVKLAKASDDPEIRVGVKYTTRDGGLHTTSKTISFPSESSEVYANLGIRKAILLSRYADLLRAWMEHERSEEGDREEVEWAIPTWVPPLGEWERTSESLEVSPLYVAMLDYFLSYFQKESELLADETLEQEIEVLELLSNWSSQDQLDVDETP